MLKFLKTALFGGLLVLLPLLFLIIIVAELVDLMIGLATPIADLLFSEDFIEHFPSIEILAFLILVGTSFVIGVLSLIPFTRSLGRRFEAGVLEKIPVYVPLKTLLQALLGSEQSKAFKPAVISSDDGLLEPAYIVEDTGRPRMIVLVPWTPASFAGSLKFVPRDRVHPLDLSFDAFSLSVGHFGVGLSDLLPDEEDVPVDIKLTVQGE